jgi:predicted ribosome quality control (RQC) complex YloA/Tae2 family protein
LFDEVGRKKLRSYEKSNRCSSVDDYVEFLAKGLQLESSKRIKQLKRKIENIKSDIIKFEKWKRIYRDVIADQYSLEGDSFRQDGVRVKFQQQQSYYQRKSALLDKLKRATLYQSSAEQRLRSAQERLEQFQGKRRTSSLKVVFNPMTHVLAKKEVKNGHQHKSDIPAGVKIFRCKGGSLAVGTSASSNDYIRSKWATKNDYWFHLDGDHSAHAIWKSPDGGRPTFDTISMVASAVLECSGLKSSEVNIIYTQVKNIKAVKHSPGKVIYKKEKHLRIDFCPQWRENCS